MIIALAFLAVCSIIGLAIFGLSIRFSMRVQEERLKAKIEKIIKEQD